MSQELPKFENKSKENTFWNDFIPAYNDKAAQVLGQYCKLPREEWDDHVSKIRDQAWEVAPFPCVGMFAFLNFPLAEVPEYEQVVERLRNGGKLLEIAPGMGQDLRALVADGAPSSALTAVDMDADLWDVGYDLCFDRDTFMARFIKADFLKDRECMESLNGTFDVIFCANFIHLFTLEQQRPMAIMILDLLRQVKGSMIIGTVGGTRTDPGLMRTREGVSRAYRHNEHSLRELWESAAVQAHLNVRVTIKLVEVYYEHMAEKFGVSGHELVALVWALEIVDDKH